jgi:hypothetical protein
MSTTPQLSPLPVSLQERSDTDRAPGTGSGEAWMREMERAQLSSWFTPAAPVPHARSTSRHPTHAAVPLTQTQSPAPLFLELTSYARAPALAAEVNAVIGTTTVPAPTGHAALHKEATPACIELVAPEPTRARALRLLQAQLTQALTSSTSTAPLPAPQDQTPLRLHLEPSADGVAAWIGTELDESTLRQHLPLLLDTLRRSLHSQGLRLNSLTLNGRIVWQPSEPEPTSHTSKETPWPSTQ